MEERTRQTKIDLQAVPEHDHSVDWRTIFCTQDAEFLQGNHKEDKLSCAVLELKDIRAWASMATEDAVQILHMLEIGDCKTVILRCGGEDVDTPNWILDWELYHLALLWGIWTDTIYLNWGRSGGSSSWRWQTLAHWVDWGIEEGKVQAYKDTMHNLDKIDVTLALDLGA